MTSAQKEKRRNPQGRLKRRATRPEWHDDSPSDEAVDFLKELRPFPQVLTAIAPDGRPHTRTVNTEEEARRFIDRHNGHNNIYYHANPTKGPLNKKASKGDIAAAAFVWGDLDPEDDETPEQAKVRYKKAVVELVKQKLLPAPSFMIDSGNGIQPLWRLDPPLPPERFAEVEAVSRAVCLALGGKPGTQNVDRILRLPGTTNLPNERKRKLGRKECRARLYKGDHKDHRLAYSIEGFAASSITPRG
jgi:hypothetical protein